MRANIKVYAITSKECKIRYNNDEYAVKYDSNTGLLNYYDAEGNRLEGVCGRSPELKWSSIEGLFSSKAFVDSFVSERLFERRPSENYRLVYNRKKNELSTVNGVKKVGNIQAIYYRKEEFHYIKTDGDGEVIVDRTFDTERELLNFVYSNAPDAISVDETPAKKSAGKKLASAAKHFIPGLIIVSLLFYIGSVARNIAKNKSKNTK